MSLTNQEIGHVRFVGLSSFNVKKEIDGRCRCRCLFYSNTCASQRLLLREGDISKNPGPSRRAAIKCEQCEKTIRKNQKAVSCGVCLGASHAKCAGVKNVSANMAWTCSGCLLSVLPFQKCRTDALIEDQEVISSYEFTENTENIVRVLKEQSKNLRLMHLNTQCMTSTFNEFLLTAKQFPMDVITLSETWLKNNPALLEYVSVPGYSAVFRNRESIKGGGGGAYIHESIQFKRRCDIENLHPDLEHLWLELPGRNKHSKALIGIMYRSKLILSESDWLECIESLLGYLTMSWDGLLAVTGDVNIDMQKPSDNLTRNYQTLLEAFSLKQIVTKPNRVT